MNARLIIILGLVFCFMGLNPAIAGQEWQLYNRAESLAQAGDLEGAMQIWEPLIEAMAAIGEDEAAGFCAQKMGRACDKLGRYSDAVKYYEIEAAFWNKLAGHAEWTLYDSRRADEIRPEIRLYIDDAADGATPGLAKHEPAHGTLLGAAVTGDPAVGYDLNRIPAVYGRDYASVLVYVQEWNSYPDETLLELAREKGCSLQVAWEPSWGLDAVEDNGYLRSFARELDDFGLPVFLRFAAEMNGDWTPWSGDPDLYIEKFRLVARVMRQEAPNVAMVWAPNYYPDEKVDIYYPGDQWVDWVGINAYSDYYFNGNPDAPENIATINYQGRNANPLHKFKAIYERYAPRKPIMICETGVAWANRYPFVDVSAWGAANLERLYGYLPLLYPRVKAIYYFNYDISDKGPDYPCFSHYLISGNEKMLRAYRRATVSPWYLEDQGQQSPVCYREVGEAIPGSAADLVAYVNTADGVSRVEYYYNGNLIGSAASAPWALHYDFNRAGPGMLEVRAYDRDGNLGVSRSFVSGQDNGWTMAPPDNGQTIYEPAPILVQLDGFYLDFDVNPVETEGRVLVPVRVVDWDDETRTVILISDY